MTLVKNGIANAQLFQRNSILLARARRLVRSEDNVDIFELIGVFFTRIDFILFFALIVNIVLIVVQVRFDLLFELVLHVLLQSNDFAQVMAAR